MSYTALYRKFRPAVFSDVKGQDHIVETLQNQLQANRIGHAYLFCGTRGTGKTTVAKIFAAAVNCEHPTKDGPCGECQVCKAIAQGASMNVIEIDAASNNGVDNIREIREEVAYRPAEGRYKVYIIDEVHMLSIGAFNALLKTLEEPPEYVIFILATTEAHKIPVTILSRCQRYDFRRISVDTIQARLQELATKEQVQAEEKALRYIARTADGAMRDALSLLDQCIAFYLGQNLTYEKVLEALGAVDTDVFSRLLRLTLRREVSGIMDVVEELVSQGRDLDQLVMDFVWYLRNLLVLKTSAAAGESLDLSKENLASLQQETELIEMDTLLYYLRVFSETSAQMKYASQKRICLEIAFVKVCVPSMEKREDALLERIKALEEKMERGVSFSETREETASGAGRERGSSERGAFIEKLPEVPAEKPTGSLSKAIPEDLQTLVQEFRTFTQACKGLLGVYVDNARLSVNEQNQLVLVMSDKTAADWIKEPEHFQELKQILEGGIGKEIELDIQYVKEGRSFENSFADIEKLVNMDITVEE